MLRNEILREVGSLARCVQSLSDLKYRRLSLHRGQFIFLTRICENPGINLVDLAGLLKVDKTTATKAVTKLIAAGYAARERDTADQRIWRLSPTDKALAAYPAIIAEENRYLDIGLAGFNPDERHVLLELLRRMRENLGQEWRTAKGQSSRKEASHVGNSG